MRGDLPMQLRPGSGELVGPRQIARRLGGSTKPLFSICTMVTNWEEYGEFVSSLVDHEFTEACCEFIVVDNSEVNSADAYCALNEFLQASSARYIMLCHHDIVLLEDDLNHLLKILHQLDSIDPNWALCGNAGYTDRGRPAFNLSHPLGIAISGEPYPSKVVSLDENFIIARREANLALSRDLGGFHHYGADLCIIADVLGWNAYVIDFKLHHKSVGTVDDRYRSSRLRILTKYRRAFRPRWLYVPVRQPFFLTGSTLHGRLAPWLHRLSKLTGQHPRDRDIDDIGRGTRADR